MKRVIACLVFVTVVLALVIGCGGEGGGDWYSPPQQPKAVLVPQSRNLINATITVSAGDYYHVPFSVNIDGMRDVTVSGSFMASGGSGNDIVVVILDNIAYTNWVNRHRVAALYSSGQVTTDRFCVSITGLGTYHLVYSNRFSVISTKKVISTVDLKWSELQYR